MNVSPSPNQLPAAVLAMVAVGLSLFVLSGGGAGALPPVPHVPAAVAAAGRITSALAAAPRRSPVRHTRAPAARVRTPAAVAATPRSQPAPHPTVRHEARRVHIGRRVAPVVPEKPVQPVSTLPVAAKPLVAKHDKQRGRSATRSKGRRAAEVRRGHQKNGAPAARGGKPPHGNHGNGNGGPGNGKGPRGGK